MKKLVLALFVALALSLLGCSSGPTEAEQALITDAWEWASEVDHYADMAVIGTAMANSMEGDLAQKSEEQAKEDIATLKNLVSDSSKVTLLDALPDKYSDIKASYTSLCSTYSDMGDSADALAEYKDDELKAFKKACEEAGFKVEE